MAKQEFEIVIKGKIAAQNIHSAGKKADALRAKLEKTEGVDWMHIHLEGRDDKKK